jgi:hypothetical protein
MRCASFFASLLCVASAGCASMRARPADTRADVAIEAMSLDAAIVGTAHNVTCDRSSGVSFALAPTPLGYRVSGSFDDETLYGRFEASGATIDCSESRGATCVQLTGTLELGADGSGFAPGTRAEFVLDLVLHGDDVTGVYRIAPVPTIPRDQYGTIRAVVVGQALGRGLRAAARVHVSGSRARASAGSGFA